MSKFSYGKLPRTLKAKGHLPGAITKSFGPRYVDVAKWDSARTDSYEFGEFVELNVGDDYAKEALPVSNTTNATELAVVVRDVAGYPALGNGIRYGAKAEVPMSVFIGTEGNKGKVVAIMGEYTETPVVGNAIFIGANVTSTVNAGNFVSGTRYTIVTPGNTNFALIGAEDSNAGTEFVANGVGIGNGVATTFQEAGTVFTSNVGNACINASKWQFAGTKFAPTTNANAYAVEVEYVG